ncbi:hypothetical protein E3N88_28578 [Mikania micrantha]|uniref:Uncharacterized protein n=1 Tax=Mikania micrantha TaxID=192012 RepID=A0A5N6N109_9ASTR|nr:hypothetical protein E3N88_28578 [Mikania micrantha]
MTYPYSGQTFDHPARVNTDQKLMSVTITATFRCDLHHHPNTNRSSNDPSERRKTVARTTTCGRLRQNEATACGGAAGYMVITGDINVFISTTVMSWKNLFRLSDIVLLRSVHCKYTLTLDFGTSCEEDNPTVREPSDAPVRRPTPVMGARPGASSSFRIPRSGPLHPGMGEPHVTQPARHSIHAGHSARYGREIVGPSRERASESNPQREENFMLWSAMFEQEKKASHLAEQFQRHVGAVTLQLEMTRKELKESREANQALKKKGFFSSLWDSVRGKKN